MTGSRNCYTCVKREVAFVHGAGPCCRPVSGDKKLFTRAHDFLSLASSLAFNRATYSMVII